MKKALITGITGQDGAYLAKFLLSKGYKVHGAFRRLSTPNFWRLQALGILEKVSLVSADLMDETSILEMIKISEPDELYNLGAQSYVGAAFEQPLVTNKVNGLATISILEFIRNTNDKIKFYQASTSEMYGKQGMGEKLNEQSRFHPTSPYAIAKISAYWTTKVYREAYDLFACQGILFNHESPLRGLEFVTRKITNAVARISLELDKELRLGNTNSIRDWGYAPEYVEAMWRIMQQKTPDDFVIATGSSHTVAEFAEAAFKTAGLNSADYVKTDKMLLRPIDTNALCGDSTKAERGLKWKAKTGFKELVGIMVKADIARWKKFLDGEELYWDALNYKGDANIITRHLKD